MDLNSLEKEQWVLNGEEGIEPHPAESNTCLPPQVNHVLGLWVIQEVGQSCWLCHVWHLNDNSSILCQSLSLSDSIYKSHDQPGGQNHNLQSFLLRTVGRVPSREWVRKLPIWRNKSSTSCVQCQPGTQGQAKCSGRFWSRASLPHGQVAFLSYSHSFWGGEK